MERISRGAFSPFARLLLKKFNNRWYQRLRPVQAGWKNTDGGEQKDRWWNRSILRSSSRGTGEEKLGKCRHERLAVAQL